MPDALVSQYPPVLNHSEHYPLRDTDHALVSHALKMLANDNAVFVGRVCIHLFALEAADLFAVRWMTHISIADIKIEASISTEHPFDFLKYHHQVLNVKLRCRLKPKLTPVRTALGTEVIKSFPFG